MLIYLKDKESFFESNDVKILVGALSNPINPKGFMIEDHFIIFKQWFLNTVIYKNSQQLYD